MTSSLAPEDKLDCWLAVLHAGLKHGREISRPLDCGQLEALAFVLHAIPRALRDWPAADEAELLGLMRWFGEMHPCNRYDELLVACERQPFDISARLAPADVMHARLATVDRLLLRCRALPYRAHLEELGELYLEIETPDTGDRLHGCFRAMEATVRCLRSWDDLVCRMTTQRLRRAEDAVTDEAVSSSY